MSDFPSIGHVAVTVKDLTVSRPWYQALIGAEPVLDEPTDGGFHHTVFSIGGTLIGLHQHPHNEVADRFTELRTGHDQDRPLPLKPQPRRRVLKVPNRHRPQTRPRMSSQTAPRVVVYRRRLSPGTPSITASAVRSGAPMWTAEAAIQRSLAWTGS